jgi:ubiquinone/menaquinone biosynthesis C-methylase UbiE
MKDQKSMEKTRQSFEKSFAEGDFYNLQTQNDEQLNRILQSLKIGSDILDLGTGSGYLAFPIAAGHPESHIVGLDIVQETLKRNQSKAKAAGLCNIDFTSYDGVSFPFPDASFDTIVTRYALHHFPDLHRTFHEISRVLKYGGQLFLCDPAPNDNDPCRFVDTYMQMKDDGHIRFYTTDEYRALACEAGLKFLSSYSTEIRFPRKMADGYRSILASEKKDVIDGYHIQTADEEIYITEKVSNIIFQK